MIKKTLPKGFIPYESNLFRVKGFRLSPVKDQGLKIKDSLGGFTLIELLVVISIIALLSSVILAALNQARAKARDAALLSSVKSLVNALALYYDDHGYYPPYTTDAGGSYWWLIPRTGSIKGDATNSTLKNELAPYISQLPNPGMVSTPEYKQGILMSRITYMRPYEQYPEFEMSCVNSPPGWGETGRCYSLTIITETDTPLGPANTPISLVNGTIKVISPVCDTLTCWGFY